MADITIKAILSVAEFRRLTGRCNCTTSVSLHRWNEMSWSLHRCINYVDGHCITKGKKEMGQLIY